MVVNWLYARSSRPGRIQIVTFIGYGEHGGATVCQRLGGSPALRRGKPRVDLPPGEARPYLPTANQAGATQDRPFSGRSARVGCRTGGRATKWLKDCRASSRH